MLKLQFSKYKTFEVQFFMSVSMQVFFLPGNSYIDYKTFDNCFNSTLKDTHQMNHG